MSEPCKPPRRFRAAKVDMTPLVEYSALPICGKTTARDKNGTENKTFLKNKNKKKANASHVRKEKHVLLHSPQFFSVRSGWFVGSGSGVVTSSPAAAICPVLKALYRSSWFTTAPLKQRTHDISTLMQFGKKKKICIHSKKTMGTEGISNPFFTRRSRCLPAGVDEDCCFFHFAEESLITQALGFWCKRAGDNYEVALRHESVQGNCSTERRQKNP